MAAFRVAICGVAGFNRGDDAIALALAQGILARAPDARVDIAVLAPVDFGANPAIGTFMAARSRPAGLWGLIKTIARADLVIVGGGSLIQDKFGGDRVKGVMGYAWLVSWLAARLGKRLVTAPLGIDTLKSDKARAVAGEILGRCSQVTARDARSLANALEYGGPTAPRPLRVPDPAFGLPGELDGAAPGAPFVLAPAFESEYDDLVAEVFAGVAEGLLAAGDRQVVLIAMDDRDDQDAGKLSMIVDRLPQDLRSRVRIVVPTTLTEALPLIRGASGIVAMRLHAMILGYGFAPISCLSRTTKTDAFMEDYHVPGVSAEAGLDTRQLVSGLLDGVLQWQARETQAATRARILSELGAWYDDLVQQVRPR